MIDSAVAQFGLTLRRIRSEDKKTLFQWRNLDEIVALSSTRRHITWEEHCLWFNKALEGSRCMVFLVEANSKPVGLVRFDAKETHGSTISIYLIPGETGKGRGAALIRGACIRAVSIWRRLQWVEARVRSDNYRSIKAFERAGFAHQAQGQELLDDHVSLRWSRSNVVSEGA